MKTTFLSIFMMTILFVISGCSKSEKLDFSLDGTTWVDDSDGIRTFKFQKNTFTFKYYYNENGHEEKDEDNGTYKYKPPFVHFTAINRDTQKTETLSGQINGNILQYGDFKFVKQK